MNLENIKEPISDCCGADINTIDNDVCRFWLIKFPKP